MHLGRQQTRRRSSWKRGKTQVLDPADARVLLDSISVSTPIDLRDRVGVLYAADCTVPRFDRIGRKRTTVTGSMIGPAPQ